MKRKTLMQGLAGILAAGMLCLTPVTSYVNAAEQGYVQTAERSTEFYGANAEEPDLYMAINEAERSGDVDAAEEKSETSDVKSASGNEQSDFDGMGKNAVDSAEIADTSKNDSGTETAGDGSASDTDKNKADSSATTDNGRNEGNGSDLANGKEGAVDRSDSSGTEETTESESDKASQETEQTNQPDKLPDENGQSKHSDMDETEADTGYTTEAMESESNMAEETGPESDTESESEEALPDFYEYWQDGPMRRLGASRMSRAGNPTVKRDDSLILHYLDFPCYFKYVTNHGMSTGGKTVAAYCIYNTSEAPESEAYKPSGDGSFSKEITYCLYNGCRYRGSTAYNSKYSAGDWKKDYYITQIAVHIINYQQGRETSIEKKLKKSMDTKVYNLAYKMVEDAYADTSQISAENNQTMEVTCSISPATQDTWVQQADGTWRTQAEFVCTSNLPKRIVDAALIPQGTLPDGVSIVEKDAGNLLSPFWFTATDAAYRKMGQERTTIGATLEVSCEEYGGWWYVPVSSSVKRQYITYLSLDETTMTRPETRTVTASVYAPYFGVTLRKKDAVDQAGVADAVYGLYADKACSLLVAQFPKTDSNGVAALKDLELTQDIYYVKEMTPPAGYCMDAKVYPFQAAQNAEVQLEVVDQVQMTQLQIKKEGELLTGAKVRDDGVAFRYEVRALSGAVFDLYAADVVKNARGAVVYQKDALVESGLTTRDDGYAVSGKLYPGSYYLIEKSAPPHMVSDGSKIPVKLKAEDALKEVTVISVTVRNRRQRLSLQVNKKDSETKNGVASAVFGVFAQEEIRDWNGTELVQPQTLLGMARSDENGLAAFQTDLPCGYRYFVRELTAPVGYQLNQDWEYEFSFEDRPEMEVQEMTSECMEERLRASLRLQKTDIETAEALPQGDASLAGAKYGLFARTDVVHPDGTGKVIYRAGDQVTVLTTDVSGCAGVTDLYLGLYYVKELEAPVGYILDKTEYEVKLTADQEPDAEGVIHCELTVADQVKKQPFQLLKVSNDGSTNPQPLSGAGFTAWLLSGLGKDADGNYVTEGISPAVIGSQGETELFTDERGYLCTTALPYGTYLFRETTVPSQHKPVKDFVVVISEHHPDEPQPWQVFMDDLFMVRLKITKKDARTQEPVLIPGAGFCIWDKQKEAYVEQAASYPDNERIGIFYTNETGSLTLPEKLGPGKYRLEEAEAPEGYMRTDETIEFTISDDMAYRVDPISGDPLIELEIVDEPVDGVIEVLKTGEKLTGFVDNFVYTVLPLEKITFSIVADEDILTPDGQKDDDGNRRVLYKKGTKVTEITTDEAGRASSAPLPLGVYRLFEQNTPDTYLEDSEGVQVCLAYAGEEQAVVQKQAVIENIRRRWKIGIRKVDKETKKPLAGGKFGLYAGETLCDAEENVLCVKDQQVAVAVSDASGEAVFDADLPFGRYYVKELEAPVGYVKDEAPVEIDLRAGIPEKVAEQISGKEELELIAEQDGSNTIYLTVSDIQTTVEISKQDVTDCAEIPGAKLTVFDEQEHVIDTWISGEEPHSIRGLEPGNTYTLREETAPFGYVVAEDVTFTVENTGEVQPVHMFDKHAMGQLRIEKRDKKTDQLLADAHFELRDTDGSVLEELVTDKNGEAVSSVLEIATFANGRVDREKTYILVETKAPEGYQKDDQKYEVRFVYEDDHTEIVKVLQKVQNEKKPDHATPPKTADETPFGEWLLVLLLSAGIFAAGVGLTLRRRKWMQKRM